MGNYLDREIDYLRAEITNIYDEMPLWSSPFGLLLLDNFPLGDYANYLDIGCGTGFPLLEIAQRLGENCKSTGIDPWTEAVKRVKNKIHALQLQNIDIFESDASKINYLDNHFDLITSNLGINNFENPVAVLQECYRVLKQGSSLCLTTNLTGTFNEFYDVYLKTLEELGYEKYFEPLKEHIDHRGTEESTIQLLKKANFTIKKEVKSDYKLRFLNGTAFLNHSFIILGFIQPWRNMFEATEKQIFFDRFEKNLNVLSKRKGELKLTVPMLYLECEK